MEGGFSVRPDHGYARTVVQNTPIQLPPDSGSTLLSLIPAGAEFLCEAEPYPNRTKRVNLIVR